MHNSDSQLPICSVVIAVTMSGRTLNPTLSKAPIDFETGVPLQWELGVRINTLTSGAQRVTRSQQTG